MWQLISAISFVALIIWIVSDLTKDVKAIKEVCSAPRRQWASPEEREAARQESLKTFSGGLLNAFLGDADSPRRLATERKNKT